MLEKAAKNRLFCKLFQKFLCYHLTQAYKTLREYFGDTVVGIFTDEPFERNGDGITVSLPALCGWQCCALVLA